MLRWSLILLVIAMIAAFLGFSGVEGLALWFAEALFFVFVLLLVISLLTRRTRRPVL